MTAIRIGTVAKVATLLVLAVVWVVAVLYLWRTIVPDGLDTDGVRPGAFFEDALLRRTANYEEFHRVNWLLSTITTLIVLVLYAWRGLRFARESAAGPIGTGMLLAMMGFSLVWLVSVPFQVAGQWWDRRYDVSDGSYWEVVLGGWLALSVEFAFLCLAVLIVMWLARTLGWAWWLPGAAAFVGLATLFTLISPYLIPETKPLSATPCASESICAYEPELARSAERLAEQQGVEDVLPVEVQDVEDLTKSANAFATGLGPTRKVFLWSTFLDGRFANDEVSFVLAHEFAHHAREHLPKALAWYALFAVPGTFLIALATRRRGGMGQPEAVPLSLLVLVGLTLLAQPIENVIGRRMEAEADWSALQATRDPQAGIRVWQKFSKTSLVDPDPPTWAYLMFDGHPTLMQRIAMMEQWKRQHPR